VNAWLVCKDIQGSSCGNKFEYLTRRRSTVKVWNDVASVSLHTSKSVHVHVVDMLVLAESMPALLLAYHVV
jgi:hypothetical protein